MIQSIYKAVVQGLQGALSIPIIRANQTSPAPEYPYGAYTITILGSANNGTWGQYDDGKDRKAVEQTWSLTFRSDKHDESYDFACLAREWLDHKGAQNLADSGVSVGQCTAITNRDNILTTEYEYVYGFDVVFRVFDEADSTLTETGYIETATPKREV